jgi:hypothetical protein
MLKICVHWVASRDGMQEAHHQNALLFAVKLQ